jgi:hypothetical protein
MTKQTKIVHAALLIVTTAAVPSTAHTQNLRRLNTTPVEIQTRTIPAVNTDKVLADRMDFMAGQIATLERQAADDRTSIDAMRAEIQNMKIANKPPEGYTRAFTTKTNWDTLDPSDGIIYYARTKRF